MDIRSSLGLVAASALLFSGSAAAVTLSSGQSATILWGGTYDGANLSASATFRLTELTATEALFRVEVANTTATGEPGRNRLTSFGITDISPNITGAFVYHNNGSGPTWTAAIDTTFPGFQTVELCIWAGVNCSGGGSGGLLEERSDWFLLRLVGSFADTIELGEPFPSKWQSVGSGGSWEFGGCVDGRCGSGSSVPEPGPLALFALGLVGLTLRKRLKPQ